MSKNGIMDQGAVYRGNGICDFRVWAPAAEAVRLKIVAPEQRMVPLRHDRNGWWHVRADDCRAGTQYLYLLGEGHERPDPASRHQPRGVHGPSEIVDHDAFSWTDAGWKGIALSSMVLYELHTGTFTPEGTFDAIIPRLEELRSLGITAVEIMPVSPFPGERNWGYDGVYPYAVQASYGGPDGLKRLVDACHGKGLAVVLDVVYNHLGPEGNYLRDFGPYFTDRYKTPWGAAINFDGPYSDDVRGFFIQNALAWITDYHIDALRIDAIHGIFDFSAKHFLQELGEAVHSRAEKLGRRVHVIAESDLNDARVITPVERGGYGLDAQWNDDFHHCVHTLLTGERTGYYEDFGTMDQLEKALREGFVYSGQYSSFRKRRHGASSRERAAEQFIVFSQNHDQVGNRMRGERLSTLVSFEALKLAAGAVMLSPALPLLFMGEEYGETAPFLFFVSHSGPELIEAVRKGRREEFRHLTWPGEPPDPQGEESFHASNIRWEHRYSGHHALLLKFYERLIALRRETPALFVPDRKRLDVRRYGAKVLVVNRWDAGASGRALIVLNFDAGDALFRPAFPGGPRVKVLDSSDRMWGGTGASLSGMIESGEAVTMRGHSVAVYAARKGV